jgi:hypothetical protein
VQFPRQLQVGDYLLYFFLQFASEPGINAGGEGEAKVKLFLLFLLQCKSARICKAKNLSETSAPSVAKVNFDCGYAALCNLRIRKELYSL